MVETIEILPNVFTTIELLEGGKNFADEYLNLNKFEGAWHHKRDGKTVHITELLTCLLKSRNNMDFSYVPTLEQRGIFFMGNLLHHESQESLLFKDGYYVVEFPLVIEIDTGIYIVGKVDLLHNKESRIEDIKTFQHFYMPDENKLKSIDKNYILQPIVYTFITNNTYYEKEPITTIYLVCINKKNAEVRIIKIEYTEEIGAAAFNWLVERAKIFWKDEKPKGEVSHWCKYCQWLTLPCMVGREYVTAQSEPVSIESIKFKKENPKKLPYIRREGKWLKTKLFKEFEVKYNAEKKKKSKSK